MKSIDVVKKGGEWVGRSGDREVAREATKDAAVRSTARFARAQPEPISVRIHKQNGQIQEERTYPRSADPRGSRG
jgi:hypothetical protein